MKNDIILLEHLKVLQQKLSSTEVPNRKIVNESSLVINDISSSSKMKGKGKPLTSDKYFILHHTAGRGTPQGVINILNCRRSKNRPGCMTLGIQFIIDRDGQVYRGLPAGSFGQHVVPDKGSAPNDMNNMTSQGVEIIAKDDKDVLIKQCKSALMLIKDLGYSLYSVYGHGEVQSNKMATEGQKCKRYATKYWNTPEDQLPDVDDELGKDIDPNSKIDYKPNKDNSDDEIEDDGVTTPTTTEKDPKMDFFNSLKGLEGILKESKELKKQEDIQRIKNLLK
jgi:hypothetical protein